MVPALHNRRAMRRVALLALVLILLPGCGFTKAIGIGTGAVGVAGTIAGFIVLDYTAKHSMPNEDEQAAKATKNGYMASGALIGGGLTLALLGAGLYLLADTIDKDMQRAPAKKPGNDPLPKEGAPGEYELKSTP
ncbi:Hypothetical protein A7982_10846 [Minicystis rosea]|nr:Hypothetical protein A7982_10846 [Minicystis rosea]